MVRRAHHQTTSTVLDPLAPEALVTTAGSAFQLQGAMISALLATGVEWLDFLKSRLAENHALVEGLRQADDAGEAFDAWLEFLRAMQIAYADESARLVLLNARQFRELGNRLKAGSEEIKEAFALASVAA